VEAFAPQGKFGLIDDPERLDATLLKPKAAARAEIGVGWLLMH